MSLCRLLLVTVCLGTFACRGAESGSAALSEAGAISGLTTIDLHAMTAKLSTASPADFAAAQTQSLSSVLSHAFAASSSIGDVVIGGHTFKKLGAYLKANQAAAKQLPASIGELTAAAHITSVAQLSEIDMQRVADDLHDAYESDAAGAQDGLKLLSSSSCLGSAVATVGSLIGYGLCAETDGLTCLVAAGAGAVATSTDAHEYCHDPVNRLGSTVQKEIAKDKTVSGSRVPFDKVSHR